MFGQGQVLEHSFYLSLSMMEVVHGKLKKQFDVIVCDILNKDKKKIPIPLLPLNLVYDERFNVFGTCSLIILSYEFIKDLFA